MKHPHTKQEMGPKIGWAEWRARQDRKLLKPRRNKAAVKLAQPKDVDRPEARVP